MQCCALHPRREWLAAAVAFWFFYLFLEPRVRHALFRKILHNIAVRAVYIPCTLYVGGPFAHFREF